MKQWPPKRNLTHSSLPALQRALHLPPPGEFDQAGRGSKAILAVQPENFEALRWQGIRQYQQGRRDDARRSFSAALRLAPTHAATWVDLGVAHASVGRLEEAVACYDKALALEPDRADALAKRGGALAALDRAHEALASFDRALAIGLNTPRRSTIAACCCENRAPRRSAREFRPGAHDPA